MSQWSQIGLTTDRVMSIAVKSNGYIFAGTYNDGGYKSTDHGNTWIPCLSPGLYSVYELYSLTIDGFGYIYAGTHGNGLYRSTNDGTSWGNPSNLSGNFLPDGDIYKVAIGQTGTVYATLDGNIYNSTDNGSNWTEVKVTASGNPTGGFQTIAFGSSRVYAGGSYDWFYYSTNDGTSWNWEGSSSGLTKAPLSLAVNSLGNIFAGTSGSGIFKSTDLGVSWTQMNTNLGSLYINTIAINTSDVIYAGTTNGIYTSTDNGSHWVSNNSGLTNTDIRSIAFDPSSTNVFAGAYKSDGTGGIWQSVATLPVELTTFTVSKSGNTAFLKWNTATEMNNYGFGVEKRDAGKAEWNKIGFIKGNGTSNAPHQYSFIDKEPAKGKYAYRLRQIDNDGSFKYSKSVELENNSTPTSFSLAQNFPNPFNPSTMISFDLPLNSFVSLKVYDMIGREVETILSEGMSAGSYSRQWNAMNVPSGVYFYRLQAGSFIETKKLVLLR